MSSIHLRFLLVPAVLGLGAMSARLEPPAPALPDACSLLERADPTGVLGPAPGYNLSVDNVQDSTRLTVCVASAASGNDSVTLLLREEALVPDMTTDALRDSYVDGIAQDAPELGAPMPVELGETAIWYESTGQLTVWALDGRVMFIVSGPGDADGARAGDEALARRILAVLADE